MLSTCLNPKFSDVFELSMLEYWHTHTQNTHTHTHTHTSRLYSQHSGKATATRHSITCFLFYPFFSCMALYQQSVGNTYHFSKYTHTHTHTHTPQSGSKNTFITCNRLLPPPCFCFVFSSSFFSKPFILAAQQSGDNDTCNLFADLQMWWDPSWAHYLVSKP